MIGHRTYTTWDYAKLDLQASWPLMVVYATIFVVAVIRRNRCRRAAALTTCATAIGLVWLCGRPAGRYIAGEVFRFFAHSLVFVIHASIALIGLAVFIDRPRPTDRTDE